MAMKIDQFNGSLSPSTLDDLKKFFYTLEQTHIFPNLEGMATLYDENVCAVETSTVFQGRNHVVAGLRQLFKIVEFKSIDGELIAAGESGDIVWAYVSYLPSKMLSKHDGKTWNTGTTRCTYVLRKTTSGLRILQNHCSEAVKYG